MSRTVEREIPVSLRERETTILVATTVAPIPESGGEDWSVHAKATYTRPHRHGGPGEDVTLVEVRGVWLHVYPYLFIDSFENFASTRSPRASELFSQGEISAFRGIGHRVLCLLMDVLEEEWPFMFEEDGDESEVCLTVSSLVPGSTEEDDEVLPRYYSTLGFHVFEDEDVDEGIAMRATVGEIRERCEERLRHT